MKYAVIKTGGKQYKVSEGDVIEIDRISGKNGKISFEEVLLLVNDGKIKVGKPFVAGEKVEGKILEDFRGVKVRVSKFKSKVRYRRTTGFRAALTKIQVEKISGVTKEKPVVKKTASRKS
ncbi:MAG TPA: 50S ribosomal protein L21 [Patescibacteria group bacterium]|jgi:large subunit ribosomal protein L21|nr:50S ribosomal protein L21 [Patescibacteria group bacterium]